MDSIDTVRVAETSTMLRDEPYRSPTAAIPVLVLWFLSQLAAGWYANQQSWWLVGKFFYTLCGFFALSGSFLRYVFGLLI
jgi:hypothetical protein